MNEESFFVVLSGSEGQELICGLHSDAVSGMLRTGQELSGLNGMIWSGQVWISQVWSASAWSGLKRGVIWPGVVEIFAG